MLSVQLLAACNHVSPSPPAAKVGNEFKDEIVLAFSWEDFDDKGFDPTMGWNYYGPPLFQSTLLRRNENLELVNDLAQNYTFSNDRKIWTFKIRPDVRFSDGQPLSAEDVAYTFNQTKESGGLIDLSVLDKAVVKGNYEVELHLKQPQITFINQIASLGIVPKHAHNKNYFRNPIGSGPYRLVQWNPGEQIIAEANPYYYGTPANIKRLVIVLTLEDATFAAAKAGRVDVARIPPSLAIQQIPGMNLYAHRSDGHAGLMLPYIPNTGKKTSQGYPIGNDVTADPAIRQAINYAINRQVLVDAILEGYGSPAYTPVSGMPWEEAKAKIQDADTNKAKQILAAAGWEDNNGDGILAKQGLKAEFSILYPAKDSIRQGLALAVAQMLKPIGIQVNVEGRSWKEIERRLHSDVVVYVLGTYDPLILYNLYHSSVAQGNWQNPGYYANPTVDQNFDKGMTAASETEARLFWQKIQWDGQTGITTKGDAASTWLVSPDQTYFVNSCLDLGKQKQITHNYTGSILANVTSWKWNCD
ncbi:ABC transporter substrate-binding protein [Chlorogloeopsis sp. ULAP02]|uniref:ABC transporter substrate-binding protein n=1 Tax=Chlorogloeopsis sp. ULAP02 TaxID=3107926 RepID=UPI00313482F1